MSRSTTSDPPRLPLWLVRTSVRQAIADDVAGDLEERWRADMAHGPLTARARLWRTALQVSWHGLADRLRPVDRRDGSASLMERIGTMREDTRYAFRVLRRYKAYTLAATATLALGIGATTAIFSVIDATLLRPLPFANPESLVGLGSAQVDQNGELQFPLSQIELLRFRAATDIFASIDAVDVRTVALIGTGDPAVIDSGAITSGFFDVLGIRPAIGRVFSAQEEQQNAALVVLSHALWTDRFGADDGILGRTITLAGRPYEVIGVMRRDLRLIFDRSAAWTPLNPVVDPARQNNRSMTAIGRLRPGVSPAMAQAALDPMRTALAQEFPMSHGRAQPRVVQLHDALYGRRSSALWLLGLAVLALLSLACANVANLTLGHLSLRRSELATRVLVGAARWRVIRMLLVQTGVIAIVGGAVALAGVALALPPLVDLYNGGQTAVALELDWRVIAVSVLVIAGTTVLCTLVPAMKIHHAATTGEAVQLASVRASSGPWERRMRAVLVSAQIAIAVTLLCLSVTFLRSLNQILETAPGFRSESVLTMQMMLPPAIYPDAAARATVVRQMLERVAAVPGVAAAGTTQTTFLPGQGMFTMMQVEGGSTAETERSHIRHITPGYFDAMRVPVLEGRAIDSRDQIGAANVCMVSAAFAKRYYPGGNAIGHRVRRGNTGNWMTIVGIAADVRDNGLVNDPGPLLYVPYLQQNTVTARVTLVVRTTADPLAVSKAVRTAIWEVDRNQPIDRVLPLESVLTEGLSAERFRTLLVTAFAVIGLTLAVVGVYAVAAAAVVARTWEASLRLALGARPWRLVATMLRDAAWQAICGAVAGVALFYSVGRLVSTLLFQTSPYDPVIAIGIAAAIGLLAVSAAALQMRRLARVSPALGLRGSEGR